MALNTALGLFFAPEPLCTLHGELYDLTGFNDHPGGKQWLRFSEGRYITALFESHHIQTEKARRRLIEFKCPPQIGPPQRQDDPPRWNWIESGFYATLRRRIRNSLEQSVGSTQKD